MRIHQTDQSNVMVLRHTLGCVSVFFLLFGILVTSTVFIPAEVRGGDEIPWYIGIPIGLALSAAGLYYKSITLDRSRGRAETVWRLAGVAFRHESKNLDLFDRVTLSSRIKRSKNNRYLVYVTSLAGRSSLTLDEQSSPDSSRRDAERISTFLELPLHDASSGRTIIREADSFGTSLRQRARRSGTRAPLPKVPDQLLTQVDLSNDPTIQLHVPASGWSARKLLATLPTSLMGGFLRLDFS